MSDRPHYYDNTDLNRFGEVGRSAAPLAEKFFAWYNAVFAEGALEKGSNEDQMLEAVHVAAAIRGGASLVHGVQMLNHVDHLGM